MRKLTVPALVALIALLAVSAFAGDSDMYKSESGWFDMNHCAFCKNLTADPGLLPHSTWETHPIADGMVEIITVDPEYKESFAKAGQAMQELGMKIQKGEVNPMGLEMCGRCKEFGMLMMGGKVKTEEVMGDNATVFLYTSNDPATVQKLHQIAERDAKEMASMMGGHEGHDEHPHSEHPTSEHPHSEHPHH